VNGENEDSLFTWLKNEKGFEGFGDGRTAEMAMISKAIEELL